MPEEKPSPLEGRLSEILQQRDFPALAEHVQELLLKVQDEESTLRQVTNIILKDVGLSLRVLRTANSSQYNRSGRPILTLGHAVALMGLDSIRDIAASLLLFRHFHKCPPAVRQLMALSLFNANHARITAMMCHYPRFEEAYLCGMFRNLGEVLIACYFPKDYAAVLTEIKDRRTLERAACRKVLGFSYEELGQAIIPRWNLPDRVAQSMRPETYGPPRDEAHLLQAITCFSHELTTAVHRDEPDRLRAGLRRLVDTHGPLLELRLADMKEIAEQAMAETRSTLQHLNIPLDELRLEAQMEHALETLHAEPAPEGCLMEQMAQEVKSAVKSGTFDLNIVLMMILETIHRSAGYSHVLFCLVSDDHKEVQARLGIGDGVEDLIPKFQFQISADGGPLEAAMRNRMDVWADEGPEAESSFARTLGAGRFGLLPVVVGQVVAGCFYCGGQEPAPTISRTQLDLVEEMRDLAAAAIGRIRAS